MKLLKKIKLACVLFFGIVLTIIFKKKGLKKYEKSIHQAGRTVANMSEHSKRKASKSI